MLERRTGPGSPRNPSCIRRINRKTAARAARGFRLHLSKRVTPASEPGARFFLLATWEKEEAGPRIKSGVTDVGETMPPTIPSPRARPGVPLPAGSASALRAGTLAVAAGTAAAAGATTTAARAARGFRSRLSKRVTPASEPGSRFFLLATWEKQEAGPRIKSGVTDVGETMRLPRYRHLGLNPKSRFLLLRPQPCARAPWRLPPGRPPPPGRPRPPRGPPGRPAP